MLVSMGMKQVLLTVGFALTAIGFAFIGFGIWDLGHEASSPVGVEFSNGGPDVVMGVVIAGFGIAAIIFTDRIESQGR